VSPFGCMGLSHYCKSISAAFGEGGRWFLNLVVVKHDDPATSKSDRLSLLWPFHHPTHSQSHALLFTQVQVPTSTTPYFFIGCSRTPPNRHSHTPPASYFTSSSRLVRTGSPRTQTPPNRLPCTSASRNLRTVTAIIVHRSLCLTSIPPSRHQVLHLQTHFFSSCFL
jgi:hypothetical protein